MRAVTAMLLLALGACAIGGTPEDAGRRPGDAPTPNPYDVRPSSDAPQLDASPFDAGVADTGTGARDTSAPIDVGPIPDTAIADTGAPPDTAPRPDAGAPAACAMALQTARFTFEMGAQGFQHSALDSVSGSWPFDPWNFGTPANGPPACAQGNTCFGTGHTQNYAQCGRAALVSPTINLTACHPSRVVLVFEQWHDFWSGTYDGQMWFDGGLVELSIDNGRTWMAAPPATYDRRLAINPDRGSSYRCLNAMSFYVHNRPGFTESSGGWETVELDFGSVATSSSLLIRFAWSSGVSSSTTNANMSRTATAPGWFIDDVRFELR